MIMMLGSETAFSSNEVAIDDKEPSDETKNQWQNK